MPIKKMDLWDLFWHLAGFVAPGLALAPAIVLLDQVGVAKSRPALSWTAQIAINLIVCVAVLMAGLVLTGHDGRMATYGALVLASAACQAWLGRAGTATRN